MSRAPAPDVKITEALQPAAQMHDTYVHPQRMEPSPLHDVARALSSLSEDISGTFQKMDAQGAADQKAQGEYDFWTQNATGAAEGTRQGLIPPFANRHYVDGYQAAAGLAEGQALQGRVIQKFNELDINTKLNMTPQEQEQWFADAVKNDPSLGPNVPNGFKRGVVPQIKEIHNRVMDAWTRERTNETVKRAEAAWSTALSTTLEQAGIDGKANATGTDYDKVAADLQAIRDAGFKSGMTQEQIDKHVVQSVITASELQQDEKMLGVLDRLQNPTSKAPLSAQTEIKQQVSAATIRVRNIIEQQRNLEDSRQKKADKLAHDGSLRNVVQGLVKDPNYSPDPKDMANISKVDPTAEVTFLKTRKDLLEGGAVEDPSKVLRMYQDVYSGKGWDVIRQGMGDIKSPATLKGLSDAVTQYEAYQQQDVKLFESTSWKRLENFITDAGKPANLGGSAFREPALTGDTLAALNDARVIGMKWLAAHPNASKLDQEQFITELSSKFLGAFGPQSADGPRPYTQTPDIAAQRNAAGPAPTQRALSETAPAGSPGAPGGQPGGTPPNPALAPGSAQTPKAPTAVKPWIQELARHPDAPPRYEQLNLGAEYKTDIEETAKRLGKDPQWVIDRAWDLLKRNMDAAQKAAPGAGGGPSAAPTPGSVTPTPPQAPGVGKRSDAIDIPGLGSVDLAGIGQDQLRAIATQVMQRVSLTDGKLDLPGVGTVSFTPAQAKEAAAAFVGQTPDGTPVSATSATPVQQNIALAATQAGLDLGRTMRDQAPADAANVTAQQGGGSVGNGLQQVSARRVAMIDATPSGPIIDRVAQQLGQDPAMAKAVAHIESSGNPAAVTGSYKGLFQLSDAEFKKYGPNDGRPITDPEANAYAGIRSMQAKAAGFRKEFGRDPSATEIYLMHQQGEGGLRSHERNLNQAAWQSMLQTGEGQSKGERWARAAIWGNVPTDYRSMFRSVDNITSAMFIAMWTNKLQGIPYATALAMIEGGGTKVASKNDGSNT